MVFKKFHLSIAILAFIFELSFFSIPSTYALDTSRVFTVTALVSSIGLRFYGTDLDKSANQAYDEYLHTARQAEIKQHLNDYEDKRTRSLLINRISSGMAAFALLYSIFDEVAAKETGERELGKGFGKETGERDLGKGFETGIWERDLGKNYLFHCSIASHLPGLLTRSLSRISFPDLFPRSLSITIVATKDF